ncbi:MULTISPECIES: cytochrome c oxidase assembly factor Coa1 family protein [Alkalimonas]|uniref:Cytochrome c oxidase assembly factor Coa1 family protein n=1 Tax=Alkalimonas mucilaginosa TaxID=3057676 RepID=A0ABU7JCN7_9GAMM|nr:cytochrome c oxidase assembly factor Coa1 family protein [Alkalimonas sp. MEB004]MEE2023458.1 cytochrome c oxidase assembly factor Coa1 family protein [Alkalimonas sp. MEB004]
MKKTFLWVGLGLAGGMALLAFIGAVILFVMNMLKGDAYELSLKSVSAHPQVIAVFGEPVSPSWFVLGSVNISGPDGSASLEYNIRGPESSGTVYAYATRAAGEWYLDRVIVLEASSGERINVLEGDK